MRNDRTPIRDEQDLSLQIYCTMNALLTLMNDSLGKKAKRNPEITAPHPIGDLMLGQRR